MSLDTIDRHETLHECPNCGKRSLAQIGQERFECLWCGFRRNLSDHRWGSGGNGGGGMDGIGFLAIIAGIALVLAVTLS